MDDPLRIIAESDGVFLRREALECGYSDKSIAARLRGREWHRVRHGAYCFVDTWAAASPEQRHLILARAVLRTTPGPIVLSHTTAVVAHGIATWDVDLTRVHVTRLDMGAGRRERDVEHHVGRCPERDVMVVDGLPVVVPARAVIEAATLLSVEAGLVVADSALFRAACSVEELRQTFERFNQWPRSQRIHVVLHHMDGRSQSAGETRSRFLFWRQGLPVPELQFEVRDEWGGLVAATDFAWQEQRAFGEFDGRLKYGRLLRAGETAGDAVFREKQREDRVRELTGYRCGRLVWSDLATPAITAARFRNLLGRAA